MVSKFPEMEYFPRFLCGSLFKFKKYLIKWSIQRNVLIWWCFKKEMSNFSLDLSGRCMVLFGKNAEWNQVFNFARFFKHSEWKQIENFRKILIIHIDKANGNCESGDRLLFIKMDTQWDETHPFSSLDNVQYFEATGTIHSMVWIQNENKNKNLSFPLLLLEALINWTTYNSPIICTNCQYYEYWASESRKNNNEQVRKFDVMLCNE